MVHFDGVFFLALAHSRFSYGFCRLLSHFLGLVVLTLRLRCVERASASSHFPIQRIYISMLRLWTTLIVAGLCFIATPTAQAILVFSGPSGLAAEAEFTMLDSTTLEIRLRNTSTGVPDGFDEAMRILTTISWDFGQVGIHGNDPQIIGGTVVIGPTSQSVNFNVNGPSPAQDFGPGTDVSGEYGFGNTGNIDALINSLSSNRAHVAALSDGNLDGPSNISGPQAGLVANPPLIALSGLGAIQNEIIATLNRSKPVAQADVLEDLGFARVEFGSDAAFIDTSEPASLAIALWGLLMLTDFDRRRASFGASRNYLGDSG